MKNENTLSDRSSGKDLDSFINRNKASLRQRFGQDLYGCEKSGDCFEDSLQEFCKDWLKNAPTDWESFPEEHKFHFAAKAIKFKGLKIYSKCSGCNKNRYAVLEDCNLVTNFKSPYENESLVLVMHFILSAEEKGLLSPKEMLVLKYILQDKDSKEIAAITGETDANIRQIRSRSIKKLRTIFNQSKADTKSLGKGEK